MPAKSAILDDDYDDSKNVLKLNKRQRKAKDRVKKNSKFRLRNIEPRTNTQVRAIDSYLNGQTTRASYAQRIFVSVDAP